MLNFKLKEIIYYYSKKVAIKSNLETTKSELEIQRAL